MCWPIKRANEIQGSGQTLRLHKELDEKTNRTLVTAFTLYGDHIYTIHMIANHIGIKHVIFALTQDLLGRKGMLNSRAYNHFISTNYSLTLTAIWHHILAPFDSQHMGGFHIYPSSSTKRYVVYFILDGIALFENCNESC